MIDAPLPSPASLVAHLLCDVQGNDQPADDKALAALPVLAGDVCPCFEIVEFAVAETFAAGDKHPSGFFRRQNDGGWLKRNNHDCPRSHRPTVHGGSGYALQMTAQSTQCDSDRDSVAFSTISQTHDGLEIRRPGRRARARLLIPSEPTTSPAHVLASHCSTEPLAGGFGPRPFYSRAA